MLRDKPGNIVNHIADRRKGVEHSASHDIGNVGEYVYGVSNHIHDGEKYAYRGFDDSSDNTERCGDNADDGIAPAVPKRLNEIQHGTDNRQHNVQRRRDNRNNCAQNGTERIAYRLPDGENLFFRRRVLVGHNVVKSTKNCLCDAGNDAPNQFQDLQDNAPRLLEHSVNLVRVFFDRASNCVHEDTGHLLDGVPDIQQKLFGLVPCPYDFCPRLIRADSGSLKKGSDNGIIPAHELDEIFDYKQQNRHNCDNRKDFQSGEKHSLVHGLERLRKSFQLGDDFHLGNGRKRYGGERGNHSSQYSEDVLQTSELFHNPRYHVNGVFDAGNQSVERVSADAGNRAGERLPHRH